MKYTIIVDTSFKLKDDEIKKYDVEVINLHTYINDKELYVDINETDFYHELFRNEDADLKTAAPAPATIMEKIELARKKADNVILMTISSEMSSTYQTAKIISQEYDNVHVFNSKGVFAKNKILFDFFAENMDSDKNIEEIFEQAEKIRDNIKTIFVVSDLKYLQKNGRIGKAAGIIGDVLKIKPILEVDIDGAVNTLAKVRSEKKAVDKIINMIKKAKQVDKLYIATLNDEIDLESFKEKFNLDAEVDFSQTLPPAIGVHSGPKVFAVVFLDKKGTIYETK